MKQLTCKQVVDAIADTSTVTNTSATTPTASWDRPKRPASADGG